LASTSFPCEHNFHKCHLKGLVREHHKDRDYFESPSKMGRLPWWSSCRTPVKTVTTCLPCFLNDESGSLVPLVS
jgi:hypothetical protein